jgi:hypothetical protein
MDWLRTNLVLDKDGVRNSGLASHAFFVVGIALCSTNRLVTVSGTRIRTYRIGAAYSTAI